MRHSTVCIGFAISTFHYLGQMTGVVWNSQLRDGPGRGLQLYVHVPERGVLKVGIDFDELRESYAGVQRERSR